jgi:hypothetical protein
MWIRLSWGDPDFRRGDALKACQFGGTRAKAIGDLGEAIGGVSNNLAKAAENRQKAGAPFQPLSVESVAVNPDLETDLTAAKEQSNKFAIDVRDWEADPERSYFKLEGKDALDAYEDSLKDLAEQRDGYAQELPNARQQELFLAGTQARFDRFVAEATRHAAQQRESWIARTSEERMNGAIEDAVGRYRDLGAINDALAIGRAEIVDRASREDWSLEQTQSALRGFQSRVHTGIVERRAGEDPLGAKAYYEKVRDRIDSGQQPQLERLLKAGGVKVEAPTPLRTTGRRARPPSRTPIRGRQSPPSCSWNPTAARRRRAKQGKR